MHTYSTALALIRVTVPEHLLAGAEVPILDGPQAQGDLLIVPAQPPSDIDEHPLPVAGVPVVHGEASGNTHWLHRGFDSPGVAWKRLGDPSSLVIGHLRVPPGQSAMLLHTDEHGANGIGPGSYAIHRKREATVSFQGGAASSYQWVSD
jgi:hypothetical protein